MKSVIEGVATNSLATQLTQPSLSAIRNQAELATTVFLNDVIQRPTYPPGYIHLLSNKKYQSDHFDDFKSSPGVEEKEGGKIFLKR